MRRPSTDCEKNIAYLAQNAYDVIITTGTGMRDETLRAANLFSDSVFIGMNQPQEQTLPNLIPITFPEDQMGFLAGALAAQISETQIVGAVCETSGIDAMWRYCEGFRAGVAHLNKLMDWDVKASVIYRDEGERDKLFLDETWGHDSAQGLIRRGADVIFAAGGLTGQGALRTASEAGIKSIGTERDQGAALAGSGSGVVTSVLGDARFEVRKVLNLLREGKVMEPHSGQIRYIPLKDISRKPDKGNGCFTVESREWRN